MQFIHEPPRRLDRQDLAAETVSHTQQILNSTDASDESILYRDFLPALQHPPSDSKPRVTVRNMDSFSAAKLLLEANPSAKVGVLNMASERHAGGGWMRGALAQEEALCLRSTLASTLKRRYYPLPPLGAIWSPRVAVFRDEVRSWCRLYTDNEIYIVGVISMAALRCPRLTADKQRYANPGEIRIVKDKMRQLLRILADNQITHCVLGALGCGAFRNPPREVARIYKEVLNEPEWKGIFEEIVFAVLDVRNDGNFRIFKDTLDA